MKILKISLLILAVVCFSCKDNKNTKTNVATKSTVKHYICSNNCENSGGEVQANCPSCNTPYTHNQAWHDKDFLKSGPLNVPLDESIKGANPSAPSPARNTKGVYHYTCNTGCTGGAASATACSSCGEALAHNTAYHN